MPHSLDGISVSKLWAIGSKQRQNPAVAEGEISPEIILDLTFRRESQCMEDGGVKVIRSAGQIPRSGADAI